jgi:hypothetical protein
MNAPSQEITVMNGRLVGTKELRTIVLYSDAHIARLEAAGQFPKRLRSGNGPRYSRRSTPRKVVERDPSARGISGSQ